VGAFALIGAQVELAEEVKIGPHAVITGRTKIGARSEVHPFACLGGPPQHQEHQDLGDEVTGLEIGEDNVIREHVSVHVGTPEGVGCTRIGDDNMIMNSAHIAHDCRVGSHCVIASFSGLAGHSSIDDYAVLGAYTGVHQFARVGESVMTASGTMLSLDAPPFSIVAGDRARFVGINQVGLKRREFSRERQQQIKRAFHILFRSKLSLAEACEILREEHEQAPDVERLISFLTASNRGFCR
jgi:UDP-N-acetylglucosamine acyltransferase